MAGPLHRTAQYRRNRALILEGDPRCAFGCGRRATTADFIVPESKGGRPTLDNLRPACHWCNSRRGNRDRIREALTW